MAREFSWLLGHFDKHSSTRKTDLAGKNFGFSLPEKLERSILNKKFN